MPRPEAEWNNHLADVFGRMMDARIGLDRTDEERREDEERA
jgi:hypothetical protein